MSTLLETSYNSIALNTQQEINFQTYETSIPAINYNTYSDFESFPSGVGIKGITIVLYSYRNRNECYYGNKNAIVLPSEIGSSVSGKLVLNFKYDRPLV